MMRKIEVNEGVPQEGLDIIVTIHHNEVQRSAFGLTFGEAVALREALNAELERGEVTKPERKVFGKPASGPTKADLTRCLEQVAHVLSEAPATGAKVAQLRATINTALDLIDDIRKANANA